MIGTAAYALTLATDDFTWLNKNRSLILPRADFVNFLVGERSTARARRIAHFGFLVSSAEARVAAGFDYLLNTAVAKCFGTFNDLQGALFWVFPGFRASLIAATVDGELAQHLQDIGKAFCDMAPENAGKPKDPIIATTESTILKMSGKQNLFEEALSATENRKEVCLALCAMKFNQWKRIPKSARTGRKPSPLIPALAVEWIWSLHALACVSSLTEQFAQYFQRPAKTRRHVVSKK